MDVMLAVALVPLVLVAGVVAIIWGQQRWLRQVVRKRVNDLRWCGQTTPQQADYVSLAAQAGVKPDRALEYWIVLQAYRSPQQYFAFCDGDQQEVRASLARLVEQSLQRGGE
jgi:heme exporter protein D